MSTIRIGSLLVAVISLSGMGSDRPITAPSIPPAAASEIRVDAKQVLRRTDRRKLLGSNIAVWSKKEPFLSDNVRGYFREAGPSIMRMPGGSYSDIMFWNGHGARKADGTVDRSKFKDGYPLIDYSAYAPSILVSAKKGRPRAINDGWHGNHDVKTEHEFIESAGWETMVCVNAGTGRAHDAAEWVRWAKKMNYNVTYWEMGNELDGGWEAGHWLLDGTEITGEIYAKRYLEFAKAMRAVNPSARIGGPACGAPPNDFAEQTMKLAGEYVDFISYHTYIRGSSVPEGRFFQKTIDETGLGKEVAGYRDLIRKYQPERADDIEIGITEWNLWTPGERGSNTLGMIWNALFIGKMMEAGMDYATHFDAIGNGWHWVDHREPYRRRGPYWAFWLWQHHMGDALIKSEVTGSRDVRVFATKSAGALHILAANCSLEKPVSVNLSLAGARVGSSGRIVRVTYRNYFQYPGTTDVAWSGAPSVEPVKAGPELKVELPAASLQVIEVPLLNQVLPETGAVRAGKRPPSGRVKLTLRLPDKGFADDRELHGYLLASDGKTGNPYPAPLPPAELEITGPARVEPSSVSLAEPATRFRILPTGQGKVTIRASLDQARASGQLTIESSLPRQEVLWEFEEDPPVAGYRSDYALFNDPAVRPNQRVARVAPDGTIPDEKKRLILGFDKFEKKVDRANIRGFFFDLYVPESFKCADPEAHIQIVMQSAQNYWMPLGTVPLCKAKGEWKTRSLLTDNPDHLRAMPEALNVMLLLRTKEPITDPIYLDRAGFLVRGR